MAERNPGVNPDFQCRMCMHSVFRARRALFNHYVMVHRRYIEPGSFVPLVFANNAMLELARGNVQRGQLSAEKRRELEGKGAIPAARPYHRRPYNRCSTVSPTSGSVNPTAEG